MGHRAIKCDHRAPRGGIRHQTQWLGKTVKIQNTKMAYAFVRACLCMCVCACTRARVCVRAEIITRPYTGDLRRFMSLSDA